MDVSKIAVLEEPLNNEVAVFTRIELACRNVPKVRTAGKRKTFHQKAG